MSYRRTCFSEIHVFQDDIPLENICLKIGDTLWDEISYGRSCIDGAHVFRIAYLTI